MKIASLVLSFLIIKTFCAQDKKSLEWGFEGQIATTTDSKGVFVNFGGPGIKLKTKYFNLSLNMMPSLRFQEEGTKPLVTPILGVGPQIYLLKQKKLLFTFPAYYYSSIQKWVFTAGLGYVLTNGK